MARCGLAQHLVGGRVQRRKQTQGAITFALEVVALGAPGRQRKHAVLPVQRLNRRPPAHAEHRRVRRRVQVRPDHVCRLGFEVRVVGDHMALHAVWLHVVLAPDALHGHERQFHLGRQLAAASMRRAVARIVLERRLEHARLQLGPIAQRRAARMPRLQPSHALLRGTATLGGSKARVATKLTLDRRPRSARIERQDGPRAANLRHRGRAAALQQYQLASLRFARVHRVHVPLAKCVFIGSLN